MEKVPNKEVVAFIAAFPSLSIVDDAHSSIFDSGSANAKSTSKMVKCSLTGHEMPCRVTEIEKYTKGKRFKKAQQTDEDRFKKYQPHIVPSNKKGREHQLFCTLTLRHINRLPAHVDRHVEGRRYQRALKKYEECQKQGIPFKPLTRSKRREEGSEEEGAKKYSRSAGSDSSEEEEDSDDSMSDLYPRQYFGDGDEDEEGDEGEDNAEEEAKSEDSDSDFDVENMECGDAGVNGASLSTASSSRKKRKNNFQSEGKTKFSKQLQGKKSNQKRASRNRTAKK